MNTYLFSFTFYTGEDQTYIVLNATASAATPGAAWAQLPAVLNSVISPATPADQLMAVELQAETV